MPSAVAAVADVTAPAGTVTMTGSWSSLRMIQLIAAQVLPTPP
jgi:hypothetical protein